MTLKELLEIVLNKSNFKNTQDYLNFGEQYLEFIHKNLQAVIVSQNENHYRFFQYGKDGNFNVTRPINSNLMFNIENFSINKEIFIDSLKNIRSIEHNTKYRTIFNNMIYTCQQCIGAMLDALPASRTNTARKINGDLFENFMRIIISNIGIDVSSGIVEVPIKTDNEVLFNMKYQHDLILKTESKIIAIGSVKTSSKDRLDKIFIDKFLYNHLTNENIPHFAIFLNDVQRKGKEQNYSINTTFLAGHFKGYTIKLTPLDGVYYCDLRPNMKTDKILKENIKTLDNLFVKDIWKFPQNSPRKM